MICCFYLSACSINKPTSNLATDSATDPHVNPLLAKRILPGFTIDLPQWEELENAIVGNSGKIKFAAPEGNGRFLMS